ncbi:unnamed protein product [Dovyalis caffra]|uniref:Lipoxygenase n=1 Tax=Dovyalis caffra TaxID=77055 RepID=A0AAV1RUR3_9ROSI|nr:unnamed protein product [Dovyalis caffra]
MQAKSTSSKSLLSSLTKTQTMLMPQVVQQSRNPSATLLTLPKPFLLGNSHANIFPVQLRSSIFTSTKASRNASLSYKPNVIKAIATVPADQTTTVKAVLSVKPSTGTDSSTSTGVDNLATDLLGSLELVFAELDPETGEERTVTGKAVKAGELDEYVLYEVVLEVPVDYGEVGAVYVSNEQANEFLVKEIVLDGFPLGSVLLTSNSWVQPADKRVFFTNNSAYLPVQTPSGLRRLRKEELVSLRGNGEGERKKGDRIYDYDVYNDLGDPDHESGADLARPVLGGKEHPYPRRCRTGRPPTKREHLLIDPASESSTTGDFIYVPRDEEFSDLKEKSFKERTDLHTLRSLLTGLQAGLSNEADFPFFTAIDKLYNEGVNLPSTLPSKISGSLPDFIKKLLESAKYLLRFDPPELMERDRFSWFRDEEFARQTLAGLNPSCIQLVTEWPLMSQLDPEIYGPQESAITERLINEELNGFNLTVEEAIAQKKLFILDYHDLFLPHVKEVRKLGNRTLYGSRTLFFLNPEGTLRTLAIELTRPPMDGKPQWNEVFRPTSNSTGLWLWRLAKANVLAQDSGYHQLITHWLRTHCVTEPYAIAANRQLSAMHPIYRLLHPHFRYTMQINAQARDTLINAGGIIETTFSPGKYCMELSSVVYDKLWRFDQQGLPKDLISRGMAVEDPSSPHGVKLAIEDYPYANDSLYLWDIIKNWVSDYVNHYYPEASLIESDDELQAWWSEVRNVGHADKKDEPWWPELKTPQDLIDTITTIIWVASGHHAAVNFGQYAYAGYVPNRPTITRQNMPTEDPNDEKWNSFLEKPEETLLDTFPSQLQAVTVMATLNVLSAHSPDEEFIGNRIEAVWAEDPVIKKAFENFNARINELDGIIDGRNADKLLQNRHGAGVMPYNLVKPFSTHGVTGEGVPNSISI